MKNLLKSKKIAVIGFGSQGHAHAWNLKDSGYDVVVGLRKGSEHAPRAKRAGIPVLEPSEAARAADVIMLLIPDMAQPAVYKKSILPHLTKNKALAFAHGFNIHFKTIVPPKNIDVFLVAPKGPGPLVRALYQEGKGVPMLYGAYQNPSGKALVLAQEYAYAIGCPKGALIKTTFKEETETDLFGEQSVLCGGVTRLILNGFETLVKAGYQPEVAYFECLHELKLIVDLIYKSGFTGMRKAISETAQWGDYSIGDKIVGPQSRRAMEKVLANIRSGKFARGWIREYRGGLKHFYAARKAGQSHLIEKVGDKLRGLMRASNIM